jgi:hypothetical protein
MIRLNPSRNLAACAHASHFIALFLLVGLPAIWVTQADGLGATNTPAVIPWNQIGAKVGANYQGDGLAVTPDGEGARLHCVFQRLDGEATPEGLWLTSTVTNTPSDRFRVTAAAVGRVTPCAPKAAGRTFNNQPPTTNIQLEEAGIISLSGQTVRFLRPGLVEEYSVSMDGVRQDFLVPERPAGTGELAVRLAVSGARVEPAAAGARLVLDNSGRKLAYSRLRATDATGKELPARIEVAGRAGSPLPAAMGGDTDSGAHRVTRPILVVVVNDAEAVYPVRIDPTFSDANWTSMGGSVASFPSANGPVYAAVTDGFGNLYIGGEFTVAGNVIAINIAQWNGTNWSALGSGMGGDYHIVEALAVSGSTLYAGGEFTTAGGIAATNIAQWNGSSWSALGSGMDRIVYALAVSGGTLYAGGFFTNAGGNLANCIAQWNGSSWSALGSGMNNGVRALAVSGDTLYAGGDFTNAGGSAANCIAKWDGSSWSALGSGMSGASYDFDGDGDYEYGPSVSALAVSGSMLYAAGAFTSAGGNPANYIAKWNGSSWSALGSGISGSGGDIYGDDYGPYVYALAMSGSTLYAGGIFYAAGGNSANCIAQWDGSSWSPLGSGVSGASSEGDGVGEYYGPYVYALAVSGTGSNLYVGGNFDTPVPSLAQWDGSSWSVLGLNSMGGVNGSVDALAVSGSDLYVGGSFTTVPGIAANSIAKWDGSSWSPIGAGMVGTHPYVYALAVSGGTLYAGGYFTNAGGAAANHIAQWDGSSWSALGSGTSGGDNPYVSALAMSGNNLFVGGGFTNAGGSIVNYIAKWDGNSWSALGSGMSGASYYYDGVSYEYAVYVSALAVSGSTLFAGGYFTNAGGVAANSIAQWNGSSWSALGSGMGGDDPIVSALAVSGSTLFAGGQFTNAGGVAATNIAQWNGSSWSALGSGMNIDVEALAVSGGTLYAGGYFTTAGGSPANSIAKWDGSSWSALGSGMNYYVSALAVSGTGSDLYAGGEFTTAGGKVSAYVARAILRLPSLTLWQTNSSSVAVSWPSPSPGFVLQQNSAGLDSGNWSNATDSIMDDGTNKMITQPMGTSSFFRLVLP